MKWEYKIYDQKDGINPDDVQELNWLGEQGWELTAIRNSDSFVGGHRFYFKRLVNENDQTGKRDNEAL